MGNRDENKVRGNWDNKWEYLLSLAGYSIGIGNVLRFPYLCYRNGGGAFLFPYIIMLFVVGLPLFLLETSIGQFSSSGCLTLYNACPIFKGNGYTSILVSLIASTYYSVLVAYPLVFLVKSFASTVPWATCDNYWNTDSCTRLLDANMTGEYRVTPADEFFQNEILQISDGVDYPGGLVWHNVLATFVVWLVAFLCIFKGVKVVGKVVWFTTLFPFVMLFIIFIRGVTLPGASDGIAYYIYPDIERLLSLNVWVDAAVQVFFSLGPGFGSLVTMSSFNRFGNNCQRDAIIVPLLNCATSIFSGFVVFSVLGFMAHVTERPIDDVASSGPALAFITYPEAISMMPLAPLWAILFFLMLFFLGIDSIFVQIEAMIVSFIDEFPRHRQNRSFVALFSCVVIFLLALFCCSNGGMYVLLILDNYSATIPIMLACLLEIIVFIYIYGVGRVIQDVEMMTSKAVSTFWYYMWISVTPLALLLIFFNTAINMAPLHYRGFLYPAWAKYIGWVSAGIPMAAVPLYALIYLIIAEGTFTQRLRSAFKPTPAWGPALEGHRQAWIEYKETHPLNHYMLQPKTSVDLSTLHEVLPLTNKP